MSIITVYENENYRVQVIDQKEYTLINKKYGVNEHTCSTLIDALVNARDLNQLLIQFEEEQSSGQLEMFGSEPRTLNS